MQDKKTPNILVICTDQFRADAMGCAGNSFIKTPNLDQIAERGVRFSRAYCTSPVCIPTRISMMTGLYPHTLGKEAHVRMNIDSRIRTLPQYFKQAGYRTGIIGKTHFWPPSEAYGSEYARITIDRHLSDELEGHDAYLSYLKEQGLLHIEDESLLPEEHYRTNWTARETDRFISMQDDRPFFLFCSFVKPHPKFDPPAPWNTMYDSTEIPLPNTDVSELENKPSAVTQSMRPDRLEDIDAWRKKARLYYSLISLVDHAVGQIMDSLKESGLLENTLVLFTSDHGEFLGDHFFIAQKEFFHEPSGSIPFICAGPGVIPGAVCDNVVGQIDLFPTVLEAAGIPVPHRAQGISLSPYLSEPTTPSLREALFGELLRGIHTPEGLWWTGHKMVRTDRYKYLYYSRGWREPGFEEELYDIGEDPKEMNSLDKEKPHICREMRDRLLEWEVNTQIDSLYPVDDRYPLAEFDPASGQIRYRP